MIAYIHFVIQNPLKVFIKRYDDIIKKDKKVKKKEGQYESLEEIIGKMNVFEYN